MPNHRLFFYSQGWLRYFRFSGNPMNAPETLRLEQLIFDNSFAALPETFYTRLAPLGLPAPYLVGASAEVAALIGLDPGELGRPEFCEIFAGNRLPPGSDVLAAV